MVVPSGLNFTSQTFNVWPCNVLISAPLSTSHNFIVASSPLLANVFPLGLKLTDHTVPLCPVNSFSIIPSGNFHNLTFSSYEATAIYFPSGLKVKSVTPLGCFKLSKIKPVSLFHILTVLSTPPLARKRPSGLNSTDQISDLCAERTEANLKILLSTCSDLYQSW